MATKLKSGTNLGGVGVLGLLLLLDGLRNLLCLGGLGHLRRNIHREIKGRHLRSSLHALNTQVINVAAVEPEGILTRFDFLPESLGTRMHAPLYCDAHLCCVER